jgi:copper chaperone CopZ
MYELQVSRMSCGGCVRSITKSVQLIDKNAQVEVDLPNKKVRVDTKASLDAVTSAINDAGYPVTASTAV